MTLQNTNPATSRFISSIISSAAICKHNTALWPVWTLAVLHWYPQDSINDVMFSLSVWSQSWIALNSTTASTLMCTLPIKRYFNLSVFRITPSQVLNKGNCKCPWGEKQLHGLSPRANHTDRATAACRRSDCQLLRIESATWSAWRILTAVFSVF
jgi:hypothetical protein